MKALITASGQLGPFTIITELSDRWVCDGIEYQRTVVGGATVGQWVQPPAPLPTLPEYITAMESLFDAVAKAKHYDNRITCALRAGYSGPFQAEGRQFATWMDSCNVAGYVLLDQVNSGAVAQPTLAAFMAQLPTPPWAA